ncbi:MULTISPECIES: hypothetical protein [Marinovum]|uniref:hypothetical protein n=1 Tax=Marinovum TaxID=367771 RepID=UPI00237B1F3A|nr:hypothetical protein [Marinovum sp. PR37]MDD9745515.1 hypothetical protein [Marinovum sp. PR37]
MAVYIVTYDLNNETKRPPLLEDIKSYSAWAKLSESSYAISTTESTTDVYNALKKHIDSDDRIYIITLKKPWSGFGSKQVNEWLDNNLSY